MSFLYNIYQFYSLKKPNDSHLIQYIMITKDLFIVRNQSSFTQKTIVLMRETVII